MSKCDFCGEEFKPSFHTVRYCNKCKGRYDDFLNDTVREGSRKSYFSHLITFEKWLIEHNKSFDTMEKKDVERYIRERMDNGSEPSSINTFISVMQSYTNWVITNNKTRWIKEGGIENMYIQMERFEKIASVKRPVTEEFGGEGAFLPLEKLKLLLKVADLDDFCLVWILAWFGCRPGELKHAVRKGTIVTMETEKTGSKKRKRRIGLDAFTVKVFDYARRRGLLKRSVERMENRLAKYDKEVGMHLMPKMLRHTFSTYMDKRLIGDEDIRQKFDGITLDDKFTKIWQGHKVRGMRDITQVYKEYPDDLIVYVAKKKHYMIPLEDEFKDRIT